MRIAIFGVGLAFVVIACGGPKRNYSHGGSGAGGEAGASDVGSAGTNATRGTHVNGGASGSSGSDSVAGSDSDAGAGPIDGGPLSVVSVTPDGDTATTRDTISITSLAQ